VVRLLFHQISNAYLQFALVVVVQVVLQLAQVVVVALVDLHKVGLMQQTLAL
jgi:hypothetical protein